MPIQPTADTDRKLRASRLTLITVMWISICLLSQLGVTVVGSSTDYSAGLFFYENNFPDRVKRHTTEQNSSSIPLFNEDTVIYKFSRCHVNNKKYLSSEYNHIIM